MSLVPMFLGTMEVVLLLGVAVLLFGGSKLAGIGKASGRAIREFKEETTGLNQIGKTPAEPAQPVAEQPKPETTTEN